jgi:uncharacterized membrane protein
MEYFVMEVLGVVAIVVAGLMVGSELAIAVFVHPTLDRLPDDVHLPAASALARVQGRFRPFWYILVLLLTLAEVVIQWYQSGRLLIWIATSDGLWMLAILYSVTILVPINNHINTTARGPERDERWGRVRGGDVRDDRPGTVVATAQWRERARDGR